MIAARLIGPTRGWILPLFHLGAAVGFGMTNNNTAQAWAWFMTPELTTGEAIISAIVYLIGLAAWAPPVSSTADSDQQAP